MSESVPPIRITLKDPSILTPDIEQWLSKLSAHMSRPEFQDKLKRCMAEMARAQVDLAIRGFGMVRISEDGEAHHVPYPFNELEKVK